MKANQTPEQDYVQQTEATRARRMRWWHDARFGMFIHWGLYAQLGRHEWVMNRERIPVREYEKLAASWKPRPRAAREWAALARRAGMRYMVMTTKHHEGFLLWDSKMTGYNAARRGPGRDLVREYVDAAREFGLRVGFYYSLMDWHHPDGARCLHDLQARQRFVEYTQGCVRELCTNYGPVDILWYDVPWPLPGAAEWDSVRMNSMVRGLQPGIIINNRSRLPEDFGTPEEHIRPEAEGRAWEACMTFNGSWGWQPAPPEDWHSVRSVIGMLRTCTAGGGNLLLNIGPKPDGSVPAEAVERLTTVGRWLKRYGGVAYGPATRVANVEWMPAGQWTRRGNTLYFWCSRWPGRELAIGGMKARLRSARLVPDGRSLPFRQTADRLVVRGLPARCPDRAAGIVPVELEFRGAPSQKLGAGCVLPRAAVLPFRRAVTVWKLAAVPKTGDTRSARPVALAARCDWRTIRADATGFVDVQSWSGGADGMACLANRFDVRQPGPWILRIGYDGGVAVFVDGRRVLADPRRENPARPDRASVTVRLARGQHEICVVLDLDHGMGWGIFFSFEAPESQRRARPLRFPRRL